MSEDLDPITPSAALDYYLDDRRGELAGATLRDHEYRIGTFVDRLEDRKNVRNMNEVDVRMVHEWRVWKREDNGEHDPCNMMTMQGQVSTVKQFLYRVADIRGVPQTLPDRIRVPSPSKDQQSNDTITRSHRVQSISRAFRPSTQCSRGRVPSRHHDSSATCPERPSDRRGGDDAHYDDGLLSELFRLEISCSYVVKTVSPAEHPCRPPPNYQCVRIRSRNLPCVHSCTTTDRYADERRFRARDA